MRDAIHGIHRGIIAMIVGFWTYLRKDALRDLFIAGGIAGISGGCFMIYKPSGFISAGVIFLAFGTYGLIKRK